MTKCPKCPSCDRAFKKLEDWPLVQISNVKIPTFPKKAFPDRSWVIWVHPKSTYAHNQRISDEVLKLFEEGKAKVEDKHGHWVSLTHKGFRWTTEKTNKFGPKTTWKRTELDQGPRIQKALKQWLFDLQASTKSQLETKSVLPPFKKDGWFKYMWTIPKTSYLLSFDDKGNHIKASIMGEGPNLGSAGGATKVAIATVVTFKYGGKYYE